MITRTDPVIPFQVTLFDNCSNLSERHKSAHNGNVHINGDVAIKDAGEHGKPLLCEGMRKEFCILPSANF